MMDQPESVPPGNTRNPAERIHSIDQFRGYTVLGMFVVNFLGHYPAHYNYHHNDYFLSYADTIMPAFLFVVGISFRFSLLKRLTSASFLKTYAGYFRRSLALCLISIILNGIGQNFDEYKAFFVNPQTDELAQADWEQFEHGEAHLKIPPHFGDRVWLWARLFAKSYVWETLAVIGLALFVMTADILGWQFYVLRTFGMNALAAYVLHKMVLNGLMYPVIPHDAAAWMYWSGLVVYLAIVYGLVRGLEKQGVFIKM